MSRVSKKQLKDHPSIEVLIRGLSWVNFLYAEQTVKVAGVFMDNNPSFFEVKANKSGFLIA